MTDAAALAKLHAWLSPGYPVGAFAYSHGLETAIAEGAVDSAATLERWLQDLLRHGGGWSDAVLLAAAWRDPQDGEPEEMARALAPSRERLLETEAQGTAFATTTTAAWPGAEIAPAPYPVALGRAARLHGVGLPEVLSLSLQAFAANLVSAAVRLVPLGQTEGQAVLARLLPVIGEVAEAAAGSTLDDAGSAAIASDIAAMRHETLPVRLFRS